MTQQQALKKESESKDLLKADDSGNSTPPKAKRMSISLPADSAAQLDFLAEKQGISQNEAIRKSIATEAYLYGAIQEGSIVYIEKPESNKLVEVVFR